MIALKVEDVKTFTSKLFLKEDFDSFLVKEVNIVTYNNFSIDGHIRQGYYTDEELEENQIEFFSSWKVLRPRMFFTNKRKKSCRGVSISSCCFLLRTRKNSLPLPEAG